MKAFFRYLPALSFAGVVLFAIAEIVLKFLAPDVYVVSHELSTCRVINGKVSCELDIGPPGNAWTPSLIIQLVVTLVFAAAALYAVFSKNYKSSDKHWAYGALGTILGYWLGGTGHS